MSGVWTIQSWYVKVFSTSICYERIGKKCFICYTLPKLSFCTNSQRMVIFFWMDVLAFLLILASFLTAFLKCRRRLVLNITPNLARTARYIPKI